MRILFIGDIMGSPGRQIVRDRLADIVAQRQIDLVIANGENSASGFGITPKIADDLLHGGIDVLTGGNHSWDRKEVLEYMPHEPRLLRPHNFPEGSPGSGVFVGTAKNGMKYAVLNLQGRIFLPAIDDPFRKADAELAKLPADIAFVLVDMHAETTSEKIAMGWYLDGRVTAVVGWIAMELSSDSWTGFRQDSTWRPATCRCIASRSRSTSTARGIRQGV